MHSACTIIFMNPESSKIAHIVQAHLHLENQLFDYINFQVNLKRIFIINQLCVYLGYVWRVSDSVTIMGGMDHVELLLHACGNMH